jgi:hypothetical protein
MVIIIVPNSGEYRYAEGGRLTFVTRSVARSSLSYLPPPILSPPPSWPFRMCGGTYEPFPELSPPGPSPMSIPAAPPSGAPSSPTGAMVPLNGHLAVKCSPLQIRHLTCLSLSLSFRLPVSTFSSFASLRQFALGRNMMFSPTEVVSVGGFHVSMMILSRTERE